MGKNKTVGEGSAGEERYRANPEFVLREVAGETLLVPTGKTAYKFNALVTFSESGGFLWKHLSQNPQTKNDLIRLLESEYDVAVEEAEQDVSSFLEKGLANGIIS